MTADFSRADLDVAVAAGVVDQETADRLVSFLASRKAPAADEESFRLLTGFNDIFVTIGLGLFLGALYRLMSSVGMAPAMAAVAAASWILAELFTRRRRMALPSIVLLCAFVSAVFLLLFAVVGGFDEGMVPHPISYFPAGIAAAIAAVVHWRRFHMPITVAAGFAAIAAALVAAIAQAIPGLIDKHAALVFLPLGLAAFALAMHFDMSDRARVTRRTDIAFWLHLLAAPLIVHPVVWNLTDPSALVTRDAVIIFALFVVLGFIALVVDRRALLVSSLVYLLYATWTLLSATAWASMDSSVGVLGVGALVLVLSVLWRPLRASLLRLLPAPIINAVPEAA